MPQSAFAQAMQESMRAHSRERAKPLAKSPSPGGGGATAAALSPKDTNGDGTNGDGCSFLVSADLADTCFAKASLNEPSKSTNRNESRPRLCRHHSCSCNYLFPEQTVREPTCKIS